MDLWHPARRPNADEGRPRGRLTGRRLLLAGVAPVVVIPIVLAHGHGPRATIRVLGQMQPGWAVALLSLAAAGPVLHGSLLRAGQTTVGARLSRWTAVRLAAGIHAANLMVRAGGIAGLGVLLAGERTGSVGRMPRSAAYLVTLEVAQAALAGMVLATLGLLAIDGAVSAIAVESAAVFLFWRAAKLAALGIAATRPRLLPRWRRLDRLRPHAPEFAALVRSSVTDPRPLARIAGWALALHALQILWLWTALHAVGASTPIDEAAEAYGIVAPLGMISILPAGLGVLEVGLVGALQHSGVTLAGAAAAVLLFRVAELWLPLAAGAAPALAAARAGGEAPAPAA